MQHLILYTNQARANNIIVNDCPKLLDMTNMSTQSIIFPENITKLPILFHGPVLCINVSYTMDEDIETCPTIHLAAEEEWNMDLILLSHSISSISTQNSVLDTYLLQSDLLERLHDNVQLSGPAHKNKKLIKPKGLASMWNITLDNA